MGDWISLVVFVGTSLLVLGVFALLNRDHLRMRARVRRLSDTGAPGPSAGEWLRDLLSHVPILGTRLLAAGGANQVGLRTRFVLAGIYSPQAPSLFLSVKVLLMCLGVVLALGAGLAQLLWPSRALFAALVLAGLGMILPGLWLDMRVARWQGLLRRGLPDAMDMLVLCLEGGASLVAAFQNITAELRSAHPELGGEMEIVQHEMLLGSTAGEALQKFGNRCGLEEVRTLASVLLQNERYGVSIAKALRIHADVMRQQRQQRAEEQAQKAAVKILFPTLLCIFPAIFIVILGPAAFRIMSIFAQMR